MPRLAGWLVAMAMGAWSAAGAEPGTGLTLEKVADGLQQPVHLAAPAGDPRLFIVEQRGRIRVVKGGRLLAAPFLDLTDRVRDGGERGLLSVAFHPDYARNGLLFVNYTDRRGDTHVERFHVSADPDRADPASGKLILFVAQPYSNHNGGHLVFGPDGFLWIGMGDGGSANDPQRNGQNPRVLLGKMLRLDVDHGDPYAIPADNPFREGRAGRPEIWALGLRNPWRFCFDRAERRLYIADVGQDRWEEIDVAPAGAAGLNYGWSVMEGNHSLERPLSLLAPRPRRTGGFIPAVLEYSHGEGCSVTGGIVYRGRRLPQLQGHYFYADYCRGWVRSFRYDGHAAVDRREWRLPGVGAISSFGEDGAGELYVVAYGGAIYRLVAGR